MVTFKNPIYKVFHITLYKGVKFKNPCGYVLAATSKTLLENFFYFVFN